MCGRPHWRVVNRPAHSVLRAVGDETVAVRIENTFQVKQPIDQVWELLSDPRKVVHCVPGAQLTETIDERTFKGAISVKVGPSVTEYKGEVHIDRMDPQAHSIEMIGKGQDVRGKGSASMKMSSAIHALADGGCEVSTVSEVNVIGLLAQLGSRMIQDVSAVMFKEFVKRFQEQLQKGPTEVVPDSSAKPEPVKAGRVLGSVLGEAVRRTFQKNPSNADEP